MGTTAHPPRRRGRGRLTATLIAAGGLVACALGPGDPARPADPRSYQATALAGSYIQLVDEVGERIPASYIPFGQAACDDGRDNDVDGMPDAGDGDCVGVDDANERLPGLQPYAPATLPLTVDAEGVIAVDPSDLVMPQSEWCTQVGDDTPWCAGVTLRGTGPEQSGLYFTGTTPVLPLPVTIEIEALSGFPGGFGDRCAIRDIDSLLAGPYDPVTGVATLRTTDLAVDRATGCGAWTEGVNRVLGLPTTGNSTLVLTIVDDTGAPLRVD
ncbi:MAG TPA: hypothetical protein VFI47_08555 [Acidimicrobiales bacterium]|nr:hypothetical protein [Acidimicrobiales bacterium]